MDKLIIPFNGANEKEVDDTPLTAFMGWDRVNALLQATSLDLDDGETVVGFVIDKAGITIKLKTS